MRDKILRIAQSDSQYVSVYTEHWPQTQRLPADWAENGRTGQQFLYSDKYVHNNTRHAHREFVHLKFTNIGKWQYPKISAPKNFGV